MALDINKKYVLNKKRIEDIKQHILFNNCLELRQVLTQKRESYIQSSNIAVHPSIDDGILKIIDEAAPKIYNLMFKEYNEHMDYYHETIGNCYGLSIMLNLYDENFKLVQGSILYLKYDFDETTNRLCKTNHLYKHSWLEKDDVVYDPALRIITPKELYYIFVKKQDEYTKEETENILRRIGFNLSYFRDFIDNVQKIDNENNKSNSLLDKIDSPEMKEEGEKLISLVKKIKHK